ncbi:MAG: RNA methyltransferase [Planctomycetota bacterium]|nr:RNA methyltransferase [Planctomycetota bacterium]MDA1248747.1 RNA methyltransferase [Planctomycetota bacterium]
MPLIPLSDLDDPRLDLFRNLKKTNSTRWSPHFITEGKKPTRRLLESDFPVTSILISEKFVDMLRPHLSGDRSDVPVFILPQAVCQMLVGYTFHCGMLGCGLRQKPPQLAELIRPGIRQLFVVCPSTENQDNLGAILRIAASFGVSGLLLGKGCCDPFSRRTIRVSMGNAIRIPIIEAGEDLPDLVRELRDQHNVELIASVLDEAAVPLERATIAPQRSCALLLGNEDAGLDRNWIELCQRVVTIPMHHGTDSLNVSVAAGILLHHFANRS